MPNLNKYPSASHREVLKKRNASVSHQQPILFPYTCLKNLFNKKNELENRHFTILQGLGGSPCRYINPSDPFFLCQRPCELTPGSQTTPKPLIRELKRLQFNTWWSDSPERSCSENEVSALPSAMNQHPWSSTVLINMSLPPSGPLPSFSFSRSPFWQWLLLFVMLLADSVPAGVSGNYLFLWEHTGRWDPSSHPLLSFRKKKKEWNCTPGSELLCIFSLEQKLNFLLEGVKKSFQLNKRFWMRLLIIAKSQWPMNIC